MGWRKKKTRKEIDMIEDQWSFTECSDFCYVGWGVDGFSGEIQNVEFTVKDPAVAKRIVDCCNACMDQPDPNGDEG